MQKRTVLQTPGPGRLAKRSGILRSASPGSPTALVIDSGTQVPVVVLAPHQINVDGVLLADVDGTPVAWEGDRVTVFGGFAPDDDPRSPAFLAASVSVVEE
jgi:hypothetical protein